MEKIFKYPLRITDSQVVHLPVKAQILTIQNQQEQVMLWAKVDPQEILHEDLLPRKIFMFGTGHEINEDALMYISTIQLHGGNLVFHLFEKTA